MKKTLLLTGLTAVLATLGCKTNSERRSVDSGAKRTPSAMTDSNAQSFSSSPNPASGNKNVGQSGTVTSDPNKTINPSENKSASDPTKPSPTTP